MPWFFILIICSLREPLAASRDLNSLDSDDEDEGGECCATADRPALGAGGFVHGYLVHSCSGVMIVSNPEWSSTRPVAISGTGQEIRSGRIIVNCPCLSMCWPSRSRMDIGLSFRHVGHRVDVGHVRGCNRCCARRMARGARRSAFQIDRVSRISASRITSTRNS